MLIPKKEGYKASKHKVRRLMQKMEVYTIYQKPNISKKNDNHKLLKNKERTKADKVWGCYITYITMQRGLYM